jgi:hypothetical protein
MNSLSNLVKVFLRPYTEIVSICKESTKMVGFDWAKYEVLWSKKPKCTFSIGTEEVSQKKSATRPTTACLIPCLHFAVVLICCACHGQRLVYCSV